ncbi:hypothetical protein AB0395_45825 [Streptosporangium sp. NPDC051023]|uniref:hypothetical protein n=1 Tax=Streptosporangium sp. NPDC051023 TaxID=3155410 RepID=UPI00344D3FA2
MIEGLLRHLTSAEIDRQYTDTHGASIVGIGVPGPTGRSGRWSRPWRSGRRRWGGASRPLVRRGH